MIYSRFISKLLLFSSLIPNQPSQLVGGTIKIISSQSAVKDTTTLDRRDKKNDLHITNGLLFL